MKQGFKEVTKEAFDKFIEAYPNKITWDIYQVPEPPIKSANDFSGGKVWPQSIVAYIVLETAMSGHPAYNGEPDGYYIPTDA